MDIVKYLRANQEGWHDPDIVWVQVSAARVKEAADEIERLRENFTHAATIAKTAWLTESCDTIGDAEYGSELCQIISDKISAIQQKEKE